MVFHEYSNDGWLVGWYEADDPRPNSTTVEPPYGSASRWDGGSWVEDHSREAAQVAAERIAVAWQAANAHAAAGMDENSRTSLLWLAVDPACPSWRRERILAVQAWWSAIWQHYATVRAQIAAGQTAAFDPAVPGPCPWTIWQIAGATA